MSSLTPAHALRVLEVVPSMVPTVRRETRGLVLRSAGASPETGPVSAIAGAQAAQAMLDLDFDVSCLSSRTR